MANCNPAVTPQLMASNNAAQFLAAAPCGPESPSQPSAATAPQAAALAAGAPR
jgi:hypothetical protein